MTAEENIETPELNKEEATKALSDDSTFATVAHAICILTFGETLYEMDPLDIFMSLQEEYGIELSDAVSERIQAIMLATSTDAFYDDPEAFRAIANTLLEGDAGFLMMDDLSIPEILWAVYEVGINHGDRDFAPAVERLINKEIENEGIEQVDELEEAEQIPYFDQAIEELRDTLMSQLNAIGLNGGTLPSV